MYKLRSAVWLSKGQRIWHLPQALAAATWKQTTKLPNRCVICVPDIKFSPPFYVLVEFLSLFPPTLRVSLLQRNFQSLLSGIGSQVDTLGLLVLLLQMNLSRMWQHDVRSGAGCAWRLDIGGSLSNEPMFGDHSSAFPGGCAAGCASSWANSSIPRPSQQAVAENICFKNIYIKIQGTAPTLHFSSGEFLTGLTCSSVVRRDGS